MTVSPFEEIRLYRAYCSAVLCLTMHKTDRSSGNKLSPLAADVVRLSRLLTRERESLPAAYLRDEGLRNAYRSYFLPANLFKVLQPLQDLACHSRQLFSRETLRILDIGAGPGTASLGMLDHFAQQKTRPRLEFLLVDQVRENLNEAEELFSAHRNKHALDASLKTIHANINTMERVVQGSFDVVILSNVLNELFVNDEQKISSRISLVARLLERYLSSSGSAIIIEPALRETSRDLFQVRDGMREHGLHIYSPCMVQEPCPALVNPRDWCHEEVPWDPPALVKELDLLTGLHKDSLKFSYLVLRKDALSLADACGPNTFRVVSEPLITKGKIEFYVCGRGGRKLVTRLDKDAMPANDPFSRLTRGTLVSFDRLADEGKRFKVGKDTVVAQGLPPAVSADNK